jgi:hypothetical protein
VEESRAVEAVQRLHQAFFSRPEPLLLQTMSMAMCQAEAGWHGAD